ACSYMISRFFFSSRRRHTRSYGDWSSDVCSSDLLIGPHTGVRDRINAAYTVADFFLMDFEPGGTNFPHHHEVAEEIYLVLDGKGQIAAGGGMDGVEGLHPAKPGDAYYFRPNCTVGFYNQNTPGAKAHVLAVRAFVPMPKNPD